MARNHSSYDFYTNFLYSPAQKPRLWRCPPSSRSLQKGNRSQICSCVRVCASAIWGINIFVLLVFRIFFVGRKKSSATEPKTKRAKTVKKGKDPNKRKRPPTAFFIFMYGTPSCSLLHLVLLFCFILMLCVMRMLRGCFLRAFQGRL
jgi:hypothetical protein